METTATIRGEIVAFLQNHHMTINQFARISGINSGTLSNILNGNRPMSMHQLDRITDAMGLEEGYFYDLYIPECIFHATPDWRRLGPFLLRCAELGKLDCLHRAARMTLENISYAPMLFDMAEALFNEDKHKAAALLYESVAECEKFQYSERLALCKYRLFVIGLGENQEDNLQAAVYFEPYIDRLDDMYQLDACHKLINLNVSLQRWDKIEALGKLMGKKAGIQYQQNRSTLRTYELSERPIIFYILYSYLIQAYMYQERGDYDNAFYYVSLYEKPDWIENPSNEELLIMEQFKEWAEANRYMYGLMSGQPNALNPYVDYVDSREDEIFLALCNILIAANRYQLHIDHILDRYKEHLVYKTQQNQLGKVSDQVTLNRYTRLLAELGIYYINSKQFDRGLAYILDSLEYSIRTKSDNGMLRCMGIFEQFRHFSSEDTQRRYTELVQDVQKLSVYAWSPQVQN
ncbi:helix-turn-helix domain protein [Paenibacillus vortex V453]|uniref:Helix-turn-helix domain protein n=1 Tax=Paenibacillus vortex V453 TaxID=715225 RepID=A0A2R9SRE3_9BACL|nr:MULTISPECIES: helix-turn-helix transcriptional regulator [Paenibacillus]AWP27061.1 transcriptional regulator [Paenibacillus sp. Cedars]EFU39947.1 helix-turn-helix domain protein [Paenibacillus vortex V453]MDH6670448.1 transcriptional regulator with XRE-family HTH domain [Paenibacillus sp. LBL]